MAQLNIYNSLTRKKEAFEPLDKANVRLYACGPTVYDYAHIGNARMAVVFDILARLLRTLYPKVTYASNITDIEDKIITAARDTGQPINVITKKYTEAYNEDMGALNILPPDIQPHATGHIPQMLSLIHKLIDNGHAYATKEGEVLFSVSSFDNYGGLSGRSRDDQIAGARVEVASHKRDPADFVLWKPSTDEEPGWGSPYGRGRPGWHIECSAMAEEHLGLPFDIHGGGADLKFPHHENEIAQSCCAHKQYDLASFANCWVHNGFVTVEGEKMSKSLGNVTLVHHLLEQGMRGESIRFALMGAHYRQPLDWTMDGLAQAEKTLTKFYALLADTPPAEDKVALNSEIYEALLDDMNVPKAMAAIHALAKELEKTKAPALAAQLKAAGLLLGILQQDPAAWLAGGKKELALDEAEIEVLLAERKQARADKNFKRSDEIRDFLAEKGIVIEDTAQGAKWRAA
ncbi:MAG: cysteine--tRNA ligase [Alphaproteobacteria bacterium]|nr:cysteine--tRNA ligase [Alphaproteobacteria bacterium]